MVVYLADVIGGSNGFGVRMVRVDPLDPLKIISVNASGLQSIYKPHRSSVVSMEYWVGYEYDYVRVVNGRIEEVDEDVVETFKSL